MGLTHAIVVMTPLSGAGEGFEAAFLVDTGATDSFAPAAALARIGIEPIGHASYELGDGSVQEFPFGLARIEVMGQVTAGRVMFGADDAEPILGVTALESMGLMVDPVTCTLMRRRAISFKQLLRGDCAA